MGKPIIWSGTNAKLINAGDLVDKYSNSLSDGAKVTYTWTGHGLTKPNDIGRPVRVVSGNQLALADHTSAANAEVAGFVYDVIDVDTLRISFNGNCPVVGSNVLEGGGSVGGGNVYFLAATAGKVTATEPTTVGYISKPIAIGTATGSMFFINYRGSTVGSTNARTQISLANNSTTNMQNCASYDAGSIEGWIYIDGTTDYRFYFRAPFSKYGAGGNYYISPSYVGDTPPAGFTITIDSSGQSIVTMPSITGFVSATCTYSLNAPAVGTNFPLALDSANLTNSGITGLTGTAATNAVTPASSKIGELLGTQRNGTNGFTYSTRSTTSVPATTPASVISATVNKGIYIASYKIRCASNTTSNIDASLYVGGTNVEAANTQGYATAAIFGSATNSLPIVITSDSTTVAVYARLDTGTSSGNSHELWITRIA